MDDQVSIETLTGQTGVPLFFFMVKPSLKISYHMAIDNWLDERLYIENVMMLKRGIDLILTFVSDFFYGCAVCLQKQGINLPYPTIWGLLVWFFTSSTAQGGGGSFKNRKPIGEVGGCESGMAERSHWWTERCLMSPLFLSLSLPIYLPTYLFSMYLSSYRSIYLSLFLSLSSVYLSICLPVYLWCSVIQSNAV